MGFGVLGLFRSSYAVSVGTVVVPHPRCGVVRF